MANHNSRTCNGNQAREKPRDQVDFGFTSHWWTRTVLSQSKSVVKAIAEHFRNRYFGATVKFQIAV